MSPMPVSSQVASDRDLDLGRPSRPQAPRIESRIVRACVRACIFRIARRPPPPPAGGRLHIRVVRQGWMGWDGMSGWVRSHPVSPSIVSHLNPSFPLLAPQGLWFGTPRRPPDFHVNAVLATFPAVAVNPRGRQAREITMMRKGTMVEAEGGCNHVKCGEGRQRCKLHSPSYQYDAARWMMDGNGHDRLDRGHRRNSPGLSQPAGFHAGWIPSGRSWTANADRTERGQPTMVGMEERRPKVSCRPRTNLDQARGTEEGCGSDWQTTTNDWIGTSTSKTRIWSGDVEPALPPRDPEPHMI